MFQVSTDKIVDFPPLNIYILFLGLSCSLRVSFNQHPCSITFAAKKGAGIELLQETSFHQGMIFCGVFLL